MSAPVEPASEPGSSGSSGTLRDDFVASLVVFLVALPLCIGIAKASGTSPAAGLITGIIGGIVVGVLAGAPLQCSGPAAGLIVIVADLFRKFESTPEMVGLIILCAGLVQIAAGLLAMGQWFRAVSPAVIHGMLAGIGVTICAGQFHVLFDHKADGGGLSQLGGIPATVASAFAGDHPGRAWAGAIGAAAVAVIFLWQAFAPRNLRFLPAQLVAVIFAAAAAAALHAPVAFIEAPQSLLAGFHVPDPVSLGKLADGSVLLSVFTIAFIASAETLLCASAVDQLHRGPRTKYDKELSAQGVGNSLAGLMGGIPMTGVIVRSAANVSAGAKTRLSAILHGVWLLLFVVLLPGVLALIPVCGLAAILVVTGYKLVDTKSIRHLWHADAGELVIYFATLGTIVATDLLTGVLTGVGLSLLKLVYMFSHLELQVEAAPDGGRTVLHLRGCATFIRLPKLAAVLDGVKPGTELHVHLERLDFIDHACLELLINWEKQHAAAGGRLAIDWDSLHARFRRAGAGAAAPSAGAVAHAAHTGVAPVRA